MLKQWGHQWIKKALGSEGQLPTITSKHVLPLNMALTDLFFNWGWELNERDWLWLPENEVFIQVCKGRGWSKKGSMTPRAPRTPELAPCGTICPGIAGDLPGEQWQAQAVTGRPTQHLSRRQAARAAAELTPVTPGATQGEQAGTGLSLGYHCQQPFGFTLSGETEITARVREGRGKCYWSAVCVGILWGSFKHVGVRGRVTPAECKLNVDSGGKCKEAKSCPWALLPQQ